VGADDRRGNLFVFDVYLLSRRVPDCAFRSEMKLRLAMIMLLVVLWAGPHSHRAAPCATAMHPAPQKKTTRHQSRRGGIAGSSSRIYDLGVGMALRYGKRRDEEKQEEYEQDPSDE